MLTDSLIQMFRSSMMKNPEKELILDLSARPEERISYAALWSGACRVARILGERGVAPGSRVVLSGANSARWIAAAWGVRLAGCTLTPLDSELSTAERDNILAFLQPKAAICAEHLWERFAPRAEVLLTLESFDLSPGEPDRPESPLAENQPYAIIFTSGTTSTPKGVVLTEANFLHQVWMLAGFRGLIGARDTALDLLPLHHVYPFTTMVLLVPCIGASVVFPRSLKGEDISAACKSGAATILIVVPQVLSGIHKRVFDQARQRPPLQRLVFRVLFRLGGLGTGLGLRPGRLLFRGIHARFPRLRFTACGGARLEERIHRDLAHLGFRIVEAYGLSETAPVVSLNRAGRPLFGSVGRAAPGVEIKIERLEQAFEDGEVLVRGPNVTPGYYNNPEATRELFRDGWMRTGDLGRLDRRGNLFLSGRSKEVLVLPSGKNIYPEELEKVYSRAGLAEEVCICLTASGGETRLTAVVVPAREELQRRRSTRIFEEIKFQLENVARELPSYQRITRVLLSDQPFPRTRLGKLRRWAIQHTLEEQRPEENLYAEPVAGPDELLDFTRDNLKLDRTPSDRDSLEVDLGLDSLSRLEFLSAFEQRFGFSLAEAEAATVVSLGDLRKLLESRAPEDSLSPTDRPGKAAPLDKMVETGESLYGRSLRAFGWLFLGMIARLLFRAKITGCENIPKAGAFILAPNHVSYLDWVLLFPLLPWRVARELFSVAIADIFDYFPFSALCYRGRIIKTGTLATTSKSLVYSREILALGHPLCMFPEGQRSYSGKSDPPKRGMAILAASTGAVVVPVNISGTAGSLSRVHPGFSLSKVRIEILPPLDPSLPEPELGNKWHSLMKEREKRVSE